WSPVNPYPLDPNLRKARALAAGHFRDGKITVQYPSSSSTNEAQAQIVRQDLINVGFDPANIKMWGYAGGKPPPPMKDADLGVGGGWCSDYPDPYDWINVLFYGPFSQGVNSPNYSHMNSPYWNRKMEAAAKLVGPKRYRVYGQLDLDLMRQVAPIAPMRT